MVFFENTANVGVDLTGTKKVYVLVNQTKLDNGSSNAEDGTGVASIQTGASWPSGNFIKIADVSSGTITDARQWIKSKPLGKETISYSIGGTYPTWYKLGRLFVPDGARFKIDLLGGVGY